MVVNREVIIILLIWVVKEPFYFSYSQNILINSSSKIQPRFIFSLGHHVFKEINSLVEAPFNSILPGTKWCGRGNIAKDQSDLGIFRYTDNCCREHDNCDKTIPSRGHYKSLYNEGSFTRSSCECDDKFYDCLKCVFTPVSYKVGVKYFNILAPPCFILDYPIKNCIKYGGVYRRRCLTYELDQSLPKIEQWRDSRLFTVF